MSKKFYNNLSYTPYFYMDTALECKNEGGALIRDIRRPCERHLGCRRWNVPQSHVLEFPYFSLLVL